MIYGEGHPAAPGTWDRDVWWALNRSARIGGSTQARRLRCVPPFRFQGDGRMLMVTAGEPRVPYGRSTHSAAYLTHLPHTLLFAWHKGVLVGRMVAWHCAARTAYFRLIDEPSSPLCPMCMFKAGFRS